MTSNLEGLKAHDRSENLYKRESWGGGNKSYIFVDVIYGWSPTA